MTPKEQIIEFLKTRELKPYQLADRAGVSRTCIYRFLAGSDLKLRIWLKIQKVLREET